MAAQQGTFVLPPASEDGIPTLGLSVDQTDGMETHSRLQRIDDLVKELSFQDDADRFIRVLSRQGDLLLRRDGLVTVSCRDLEAPRYRITRSWRWAEAINPWTETHRLPIHDRGLLGDLLYAGKPAIISRLAVSENDPAWDHLKGMQSLVCAPSYDRGRALNMVMMVRHEPDSFTYEDLETLLLQNNLIGRAVNNLLLAQQLEEAYRRLDEEMQQVGRVQRHLLPTELPKIDGLELGASYITCSRAGGDYYDVFPLQDGQWGLFMADVSGHGVSAAVVMAMMHTLLHAYPEPLVPPHRVLEHVNQHLLSVAPEGMFATAFYGTYEPASRRLRYAIAGHPLPRMRHGCRYIRELEGTGGLPLGVLPQATWSEKEVTLIPGDAMLLYTDGIIEGTNHAGESFGRQRLDNALRLGPYRAQRLVQHIERNYQDYCAGAPDMDDRTLFALVAAP